MCKPIIEPYRDYMIPNPEIHFFGTPIESFTTAALAPFADASGAFTRSFDVTVKDDPRFLEIFILSTVAKYETADGSIPTIQLLLIDDDGNLLYYSPVYEIGSKREFYRRQWRMPPVIDRYRTVRLSFIIPEGVRLFLRDIRLKADNRVRERDIGIRYHAHCGVHGYASADTVFSYQMAGELGFTSCITIPKFTKDGIGVCFHDDVSVIKLLRQEDGTRLEAGSPYDKPIWEYTLEELHTLDMGLKKSDIYRGAKVPTMDEFFRICSMTGMQPIFSVHPSLNREQWIYVREHLEKYRLLEHFRVKSHKPENVRICEEVFGDKIAGYILIQPTRESWDPDEFVKTCGLDKTRRNIVVEYFNIAVTEEKIRLARKEGYRVSIACARGGNSGPSMKKMIDLGVSEFTVDHHCSMGLDW